MKYWILLIGILCFAGGWLAHGPATPVEQNPVITHFRDTTITYQLDSLKKRIAELQVEPKVIYKKIPVYLDGVNVNNLPPIIDTLSGKIRHNEIDTVLITQDTLHLGFYGLALGPIDIKLDKKQDSIKIVTIRDSVQVDRPIVIKNEKPFIIGVGASAVYTPSGQVVVGPSVNVSINLDYVVSKVKKIWPF